MHLPIEFLQKVAEFTRQALDGLDDLDTKSRRLEREKRAQEQVKYAQEVRFETALRKAANALYDSDFITDELDRKEFLKRAKADPVFLAEVLGKVCRAADVSSIGAPSNSRIKKSIDETDPVMVRAFGGSGPGGYLWDDDDTKD